MDFTNYQPPEEPPKTPPPPPPGDGPPEFQQVPSYLVQAILVTLFCCPPFGIPALIFAAQSDGMLKAGDPVQAADSAAKARVWCWVSFGCGMAYLLFAVLAAIAGG